MATPHPQEILFSSRNFVIISQNFSKNRISGSMILSQNLIARRKFNHGVTQGSRLVAFNAPYHTTERFRASSSEDGSRGPSVAIDERTRIPHRFSPVRQEQPVPDFYKEISGLTITDNLTSVTQVAVGSQVVKTDRAMMAFDLENKATSTTKGGIELVKGKYPDQFTQVNYILI